MLGELTTLPSPAIAGLKGPTSKGRAGQVRKKWEKRGGEGKGRERKRWKGRERVIPVFFPTLSPD